MALIDTLLFETERRSILFHKDTSMPDGTQLGYNSDPNNAVPGDSDGEFLLHNCPSGTRYLQKNVTPFQFWEKVSDDAGGLWIQAGSSGETWDYITLPTNSAIGGNRAIAIKNLFAVYASCIDLTASTTIGISTGAVSSGTDVQLQFDGKMVISGNTWVSQEPIFLAENGLFVQTIPATGFIQKLGVAFDATTILIDIAQPIYRS